jgi:hypothetical protein
VTLEIKVENMEIFCILILAMENGWKYIIFFLFCYTWKCRNPTLGISVKVKPTLPKVGNWSFTRLPKTQSSNPGVKTPRIGVFFIPLERSWSVNVQNGLAWAIWTSAAQVMGKKKGRESNWQFDSWPLKVGNRPDADVYNRSATWRWKALEESYNFGSNLVPIRARSEKLWTPKVSRVQTGTISRLHLGSPERKSHLDVASARSCKEYYKREGGGFPRIRAVVSRVSPSARGLSQHPKGCKMSSNQLMVGFGCRIV